MVEMRMAQHDRVYFCCIEGKGVAIALFVTPATLDQAAVKQDLLTAHVEDVTGTGDFGRRAKKFEFHGFCITLLGGQSIS